LIASKTIKSQELITIGLVKLMILFLVENRRI